MKSIFHHVEKYFSTLNFFLHNKNYFSAQWKWFFYTMKNIFLRDENIFSTMKVFVHNENYLASQWKTFFYTMKNFCTQWIFCYTMKNIFSTQSKNISCTFWKVFSSQWKMFFYNIVKMENIKKWFYSIWKRIERILYYLEYLSLHKIFINVCLSGHCN